MLEIRSLIKPSTAMEVLVVNVAEGEAEERGLPVARKMLSLLQSEPKSAKIVERGFLAGCRPPPGVPRSVPAALDQLPRTLRTDRTRRQAPPRSTRVMPRIMPCHPAAVRRPLQPHGHCWQIFSLYSPNGWLKVQDEGLCGPSSCDLYNRGYAYASRESVGSVIY
jgi:hypothetical protein